MTTNARIADPAASSSAPARRLLLKRLLTLTGAAGLLGACGRSSNVRYVDGKGYRDDDFPASNPTAPAGGGS